MSKIHVFYIYIMAHQIIKFKAYKKFILDY